MKRLLFVCLGNICRSPAAECIMRKKVELAGLSTEIQCDSAGTASYHIGERPDSRMVKYGSERGYNIDGSARQFDPDADFKEFDYILTMDQNNYLTIKDLATDSESSSKVFMMTDFCKIKKDKYVPDPYYGGREGFERVIDILEDACSVLLEKVKKEIKNAK